MLAADDRVLVAVSGGKDSTLMLAVLAEIQRRAPFPFSFQGVLIDQGQPGFDPAAYQGWLTERGLAVEVIRDDTYSIVQEKVPAGKTTCGLCSRLRRGILHSYAIKHGFNKIALGHHRDDFNETLLLNVFFSGKLAAMAPVWTPQDYPSLRIIRPLGFIAEKAISEWARANALPVIPCNLCGSQADLKRVEMKLLLNQLEKKYPDIRQTMLAAQRNVVSSHLLQR